MSHKPQKKSLQELILGRLARSRASRQDDVVEYLEAVIEEIDGKSRKVKPRYVINRAIKKMVDDNLLSEHETEQSSFLSLTSSGRQKLRSIKLSSTSHLVSTTWDGYWRMVIVDIPDNRKKDQDAIRYLLKKAQFVQIKPSVWISPYPLEHLMINMKEDMGFADEVMVVVTNKLDSRTEAALVEKFAGEAKKEG
ncbi:hypothetical protein KC929_00705 [Patescibacteria group bacterium]|nr:hypothetical protein [Patescibacteria group bacterium]